MKPAGLGITQTHFAGASFASTAVSATAKVTIGVLSQSMLALLNGVYLVVLCAPKAIAFFSRLSSRDGAGSSAGTGEVGGPGKTELPGANETSEQLLISLSLVALGITFALFSLGSSGSRLEYGTIPAITFATCAFVKLGVAIWGMVKLRGQRTAIVTSGKLTSLADGMASIVLTQMALRGLEGQQTDVFDMALGVAVGAAIVVMGAYAAWAARRGSAA